MRRSERAVSRLNYQVLHSTVKKVIKKGDNEVEELTNQLSELSFQQRAMDNLIAEEGTVSDDIDDFIDENPIELLLDSTDELDAALEKLSNLRSLYRTKHKLLENSTSITDYATQYGDKMNQKLQLIKDYIKDAKDRRHKAKMKKFVSQENARIKDDNHSKNKIFQFQMDEVHRMIKELKQIYEISLAEETDNDIKRRRDELSSRNKESRKIGEKIEGMISNFTNDDVLMYEVDTLKSRYEEILLFKNSYLKNLKTEINNREIDMNETFQISSLNIKLSKFKDYDSPLDVFTFRSTFEKIYLKSNPKNLLPDLLKNNFLEGPALTLVKSIDNIDEIWERLQAAYGNCKIMLAKKLSEFNSMEGLWKHKHPSKIAEGLAQIINCMYDLMKLAKQHNIENNLFYGDSLDRIYKLCGDDRMTRWFVVQYEKTWSGEHQWLKFISFLEKDIKINQQKAILKGIGQEKRQPIAASKETSNRHFYANDDDKVNNCFICGGDDHISTNGPSGSKLVQYFPCKKFVEISPALRCNELRKKGLCIQCLSPGAKYQISKHKEGKCQRDFTCKHPSHDRYTTKMHVLVCEEHKDTPENKDLLNLYRQKCILRQSADLPDYSKNIHLTYHSTENNQAPYDEKAIYMLQTIEVDKIPYTIFYDSGCGDFVTTYHTVKNLGHRANKEFDGPIKLGGVGGISTETPHGIYSVRLPLIDKNEAIMTGVCLDKITEEFPYYPINGKVNKDIRHGYIKSGGDIRLLPRLPQKVGGNVHLMIGIKYVRYFPNVVFQLPSGLTIYNSHFRNPDGSRGVIGGPHHIFTEIERFHHLCQHSTANFVSNQLKIFKDGFQVNPDVGILDFKNNNAFHDICLDNEISENQKEVLVTRQLKLFEKAEEAGSSINYRCHNCRDCKNCKSHDNELMSIKEEVEQDRIEKSVIVKVDEGLTMARLPFMHDPAIKLCPNRSKALKVLNQQVRKLNKNEKDREDVVNSEKKLQSLGHVDYIKNLSPAAQKSIDESKIQNYIPWRAVWKTSSISTPCRLVFDASQPTASGFSFNDTLAKGRNNMNKLVEIFVRWRSHLNGYHTDIQKMYNCVTLHDADWCYQRYIWQDELDENSCIEEKVIKTLIYGVKSSGNQAETGLQKTAAVSKVEFPEVHKIILRDVYVDDCLSGDVTKESAMQRADQLELVLQRGGFSLKGITMSGSNPLDKLSTDGKSIGVAGLKWEPEKDLISLDVKEINFAKKQRGRKNDTVYDVPENLTRRHCTSKVAEIFDIIGMFTPIIATMKLDLHDLVIRKLDWDDRIPDNQYG